MSRVSELAEIWRQLVGLDHHKHRDGVFFVTKKWDYDGESFYAEHNGYIAPEWNGEERATFEEAEADLIKFLIDQIRNQYVWAKRVLDNPEERDYLDHEATQTLEIVERNLPILKGENK